MTRPSPRTPAALETPLTYSAHTRSTSSQYVCTRAQAPGIATENRPGGLCCVPHVCRHSPAPCPWLRPGLRLRSRHAPRAESHAHSRRNQPAMTNAATGTAGRSVVLFGVANATSHADVAAAGAVLCRTCQDNEVGPCATTPIPAASRGTTRAPPVEPPGALWSRQSTFAVEPRAASTLRTAYIAVATNTRYGRKALKPRSAAATPSDSGLAFTACNETRRDNRNERTASAQSLPHSSLPAFVSTPTAHNRAQLGPQL